MWARYQGGRRTGGVQPIKDPKWHGKGLKKPTSAEGEKLFHRQGSKDREPEFVWDRKKGKGGGLGQVADRENGQKR